MILSTLPCSTSEATYSHTCATSFLIHSIRLQYLRNVEDPYGSRLISLDPSYRSNPYVLHAGLADVERWPELAMPNSPAPSDDEGGPNGQSRPSGYPGATGLKYTTTIMGPSRTGALGLRTSGKRTSVQDTAKLQLRRSVSLPRKPNGRLEKGPTGDSTSLAASASPTTNIVEAAVHSDAGLGDLPDGKPAGPTASSAPQLDTPQLNGAQLTVPIAFIPKFKGAAEMEARRRLRMANRNQLATGAPIAMRPQLSAAATLKTELSSSSSSSSSPASESSSSDMEEQGVLGDEDEDDDFDDVVDDIDDDEFDP